eukprot:5244102-Pleurochrysis_carterae.AAC.2
MRLTELTCARRPWFSVESRPCFRILHCSCHHPPCSTSPRSELLSAPPPFIRQPPRSGPRRPGTRLPRRHAVSLCCAGRYQRQYEIEYVEKVKAEADGDPRIEIHDVTSDVDQFYRVADVLLFTSLNEARERAKGLIYTTRLLLRAFPFQTAECAAGQYICLALRFETWARATSPKTGCCVTERLKRCVPS